MKSTEDTLGSGAKAAAAVPTLGGRVFLLLVLQVDVRNHRI